MDVVIMTFKFKALLLVYLVFSEPKIGSVIKIKKQVYLALLLKEVNTKNVC